jgi:hypothetical protein
MNNLKSMKRSVIAVSLSLALIIPQVPNVPTTEAAQKVYIAPTSGTKYHAIKRCRGLNRAKIIKKTTLKKAKRSGYKKCKLCW